MTDFYNLVPVRAGRPLRRHRAPHSPEDVKRLRGSVQIK
jgi:isocitrate lyase